METPGGNPTYRFMFRRPRLGQRVFIDPAARVSGNVELGDDVSVWPMAVLRGDVNRIVIGARSNIQDGCIVHVTHEFPARPEGHATVVGEDVTVGHGAILHGCIVGDRCLVGMGAIIMDGAVLEPDCLVAGGAVVTPGTVIPAGTLWRGNPARQARELSDKEIAWQAYSAAHYVRLKDLYLTGQHS